MIHLLSPLHLNNEPDRCFWDLVPSGFYTTNSFFSFKAPPTLSLVPSGFLVDGKFSLYEAIRRNHYTKKVKFFLWEVTHELLIHKISYIAI